MFIVQQERSHDFQMVNCECLVKIPLCEHSNWDQFPPRTKHNKSCIFSLAYLGTQLGDERSTSHVAYRFMWTGRLEVMLTGLEGCMCGEGTPPVRGSPPRSDILEAGDGLSVAAGKSKPRSSLASRRDCSLFSGVSFSLEPKVFSLLAYTAPVYGTRKRSVSTYT